MGRKNKNVKIQLNKALDGLLCLGTEKIKNDTNPNRAEGIHSASTATTYRSVINMFGDYLKGEGVRNIADITETHIRGFLGSRANRSQWTLSKDLSAINKVLGTRYEGRAMGLTGRRSANILNNRGFAKQNTSGSERNAEAIRFVAATGIRRQSIAAITPGQAVYGQSGQVVGFNVTEKGGRNRCCVVLESEREWVTQLVKSHGAEPDAPMLKAVDKNANPHYYRAEYAKNLYEDLKGAGDYYDGMKALFINEQAAERAMGRYARDMCHGYILSVIAEVSQNMGHNRLDVILTHYLR